MVLRDVMGSEEAILQAARVSYGAGTKSISDDTTLIRYLLRKRHSTPFEMVELKFHVRVPMDVWRQWIRHRTANVNEYSTRYSHAIDDALYTDPGAWRLQDGQNRQGSDGYLPAGVGERLSQREREFIGLAREVYEDRIAQGVAREQARKDLPLSTHTEAYWKIDLHNLLHFLGLRCDSHAQAEIRECAWAMANIVAVLFPRVWEAFQDYHPHFRARLLSGPTVQLSRALLEPSNSLVAYDTEAEVWAHQSGIIQKTFPQKRSRERDEAIAHLKDTGVLDAGFVFTWAEPASDGESRDDDTLPSASSPEE